MSEWPQLLYLLCKCSFLTGACIGLGWVSSFKTGISYANQNHNEISPHTPRNAVIKKARNNKYWRGCGEKGTLVYSWWECKLMRPLGKTVWGFLKRIKTRTTIQSSNSTSGYLFEGNESTHSKRYMHPYVHHSVIYNSQDMGTT